MARIKWTGTELAAPPGDSYWAPQEERDFDDTADAEWIERLQRNPGFVQVKQTKAPPKSGEVPADQQPTTGAEGS